MEGFFGNEGLWGVWVDSPSPGKQFRKVWHWCCGLCLEMILRRKAMEGLGFKTCAWWDHSQVLFLLYHYLFVILGDYKCLLLWFRVILATIQQFEWLKLQPWIQISYTTRNYNIHRLCTQLITTFVSYLYSSNATLQFSNDTSHADTSHDTCQWQLYKASSEFLHMGMVPALPMTRRRHYPSYNHTRRHAQVVISGSRII